MSLLKKMLTGALTIPLFFMPIQTDKVIKSSSNHQSTQIALEQIVEQFSPETIAFSYPFTKMIYNYPHNEYEVVRKIEEAINYDTNFKEIIKPLKSNEVLLAREHYFNKFGYSNTTNILTGLITGCSFFDPSRLGNLDVFREKLLEDGERVLEFHPCQGCKDMPGYWWDEDKWIRAIKVLTNPKLDDHMKRIIENVENLSKYAKTTGINKLNTEWSTEELAFKVERNIAAAELYNVPGVLNPEGFFYLTAGWNWSYYENKIINEPEVKDIRDYFKAYYKPIEHVKNASRLHRQNPANDLAQVSLLNNFTLNGNLARYLDNNSSDWFKNSDVDFVLSMLGYTTEEVEDYLNNAEIDEYQLEEMMRTNYYKIPSEKRYGAKKVIGAINMKLEELIHNALEKLTDFDSDFYKWLKENYSDEYVRSFVEQNIETIGFLLKYSDPYKDGDKGYILNPSKLYKEYYQALLKIYKQFPEIVTKDAYFPPFPFLSNKEAIEDGWDIWIRPFTLWYIQKYGKENLTEKLINEYLSYNRE